MNTQLVINGVPDSIRLDGWWLESTAEAEPVARDTGQKPIKRSKVSVFRNPQSVFLLLVLVSLADWLFWAHSPGLSVAIFAVALSASILAMKLGTTSPRAWAIAMGGQVIANMPVIEQLQLLSLLFTGAGITTLVVWVSYGRLVEWWQAAWAMVRGSTVGTLLLPVGVVRDVKTVRTTDRSLNQMKALILPISVGLVFLLLLTSANPILEQFLNEFAQLEFITDQQAFRLLFWVVVACVVWPYLNLSTSWMGPAASGPSFKPTRIPWLASLVNPDSVRNSLVLFNALFLFQTILDIGVLTGGMSLPEGMTYASYAHRGAYPLVVTALLAGAFAIITHRMVRESRVLMNLLFLWLGQTLFLVITAAFRLTLYVEVYSLTYLRVAAFIWMGLVAIGLILTLVQITKAYSVAWLLKTNLVALMGTLYLCCFVNFAWVIADYNLYHSQNATPLDSRYICGLGEHALPWILEHDRTSGRTMCGEITYMGHTPIKNWRDWSFREWRLKVYLVAEQQGQVADARPNPHR